MILLTNFILNYPIFQSLQPKKKSNINRKYLKKNKLKKSKTFRYKQRQTGRMNYGVIIVAD